MLRNELAVMFGRVRIRLLLLVIAAIPVGYAIGVRLSGHATGDAPAFVGQIPQNGLFAGLAGLTTTVAAVLPLIVAVVAGDAIAGEADFGTLRTLLTAPLSRRRLLGVKLAAVCVFCLTAAFVAVLAGSIAGALLFHVGPVPTALGLGDPTSTDTLTGPTLSIFVASARLVLAALIGGVQLFGFAAIGVFLSTLTRVPLGATVALAGVLGISDALESVGALKAVRGAIPSTYWDGFTALFHTGRALEDITSAVFTSMAYLLVFGLLALWKFSRTDIAT